MNLRQHEAQSFCLCGVSSLGNFREKSLKVEIVHRNLCGIPVRFYSENPGNQNLNLLHNMFYLYDLTYFI